MNIRRCLLGFYRFLLHCYPAAFRKRFSAEMLEWAESAELVEWPLIFGDTGMGIVRCWIEGSRSTAISTEPDAYLPLGKSPGRGLVLLRGLTLSTAIIVGLSYANYRWAAPHSQCTKTLSENAQR